jgi:uncharacterized membrane protein
MAAEIFVLRIVHVLGGVLWVGTAVFVAAFLMPAMKDAGPAAGPVMAGLQKRKMMVFMPVTAILTILSGIRLLMIVSNGFDGSYFATGSGRTFGWAGVIAIIAFLLGMFISRPAMGRAGAIAASLPSTPEAERGPLMQEMQALRERAAKISLLVAVLLVLTVLGMAVGRYA